MVNYLGKDNLTPENIRDTFGLTLDNTSGSNFIWLRSADAGGSGGAWGVRGSHGRLGYSYVYRTNSVRPAFVVDLTKIG